MRLLAADEANTPPLQATTQIYWSYSTETKCDVCGKAPACPRTRDLLVRAARTRTGGESVPQRGEVT